MADISPEDMANAANYSAAKISNNPNDKYHFKLIYKNRPQLNRTVDVEFDDTGKPVWNNVPASIAVPLDQCKPFDVKRHPFSCLTLTIQHLKDTCFGLRPADELANALEEYKENIKYENPSLFYKNMGEIYSNLDSKVFKMEHKAS